MQLCIVSHVRFYKTEGTYICRPGFAKLIEMVSPLYDVIDLCVPVYTKNAPNGYGQFNISNVKICSLPPYYKKSHLEVAAFMHPLAIIRAMWTPIKQCDVVWITLPNFVSILAWVVCLMQSKAFALRVAGNFHYMLRLAFQVRRIPVLGPFVGGAYQLLLNVIIKTSVLTLVHGQELAKIYKRGNPQVVSFVGSTIYESEIATTIADSRSRDFRILYVGRLNFKKGLRELLIAGKNLLSKGYKLRIRLVGDGKDREEIKKLAKDLGIDSRVEFVGWVPVGLQLQKEYRSANLFLLPSYSEGSPKVVIEAMANGLPVVATNVGNVPYLVEHQQTGLVIPSRNVRALENTIETLLSNETMRQHMAKAALSRAREFTIEAERKCVAEAFLRFGLLNHNAKGT